MIIAFFYFIDEFILINVLDLPINETLCLDTFCVIELLPLIDCGLRRLVLIAEGIVHRSAIEIEDELGEFTRWFGFAWHLGLKHLIL